MSRVRWLSGVLVLLTVGCEAVSVSDLPAQFTPSEATTPSPTAYGSPTATPTQANVSSTPAVNTASQPLVPTASVVPTPSSGLTPTPDGPLPTQPSVQTPTATVAPSPTPPLITPTPTLPPDLDGDGVRADIDCNDSDAEVYPGAPERCNEQDDDCDELTDESPDSDGDGYTICQGDCDDTNAFRSPDASYELQSGVDDDCDGQVDEYQDVSEAFSILGTDEDEGEAWCGSAMGTIGDLDNDGIDDWAVACPLGEGDRGYVEIFYGNGTRPSADAPLDRWRLVGQGLLSVAGSAIAMDGDLNGDGINDIAIGEPGVLTGLGGVSIALGSDTRRTGETNTANLDETVFGDNLFEGMGWSVAFADLDGDDASELLVGSPGALSAEGRVYVLHGGVALDSYHVQNEENLTYVDPLVDLPDETILGGLGVSMAALGDVDGDGFEDVAVGAYGAIVEADNGDQTIERYEAGAVQILYGGPLGEINDDDRMAVIGGSEPGAQFGFDVSGPGDLNGDGYADLIVGSPGADGGSGRVHVIFGRPARLDGTVFVERMPSAGPTFTCDQIGCALGTLYNTGSSGDVNGDLRIDIAVGAVGFSPTGAGADQEKGYVGIFYGSEALWKTEEVEVADANIRFVGASAGDALGSSGHLGDIDQDGYGEILLGAYTAEIGQSPDSGAAYLFFGMGLP